MLALEDSGECASWKERRTRGESSASTESARDAVCARDAVGKGRERMLEIG
jgi:hypothetical protein